MIRLQIEEILRQKNITKSGLAKMLDIDRQNVNSLMETKNLDRLQKIADVLEVDLSELIFPQKEESKQINGYIEYNNQIYAIKSLEDFTNLSNIINNDNNVTNN